MNLDQPRTEKLRGNSFFIQMSLKSGSLKLIWSGNIRNQDVQGWKVVRIERNLPRRFQTGGDGETTSSDGRNRTEIRQATEEMWKWKEKTSAFPLWLDGGRLFPRLRSNRDAGWRWLFCDLHLRSLFLFPHNVLQFSVLPDSTRNFKKKPLAVMLKKKIIRKCRVANYPDCCRISS